MSGARQGLMRRGRHPGPCSGALTRRTGNILPLLLVWALLLCHGVLGFMHEVPRGCDGTHVMRVASPDSGHAAAHAGARGMEAPKCGHVLTAYFAVLLGLFGAAFLWRLPGGLGALRKVVFWPLRSYALYRFAHLPRGPTFPLLQAYRL